MNFRIAMVDITGDRPGAAFASSGQLAGGYVHHGFLGRFQQAIGTDAEPTPLRRQVRSCPVSPRVRVGVG